MSDKSKLIKEKIKILNEASKAYYKDNMEIMSDYEYDKKLDELEKLEKETGIVFSNSPTVNVGYEILESLPKENHTHRMLSLDKTKSVEELKTFLGDKVGLLSWKLDGLTVVLTYNNGKLQKAVTRGNGDVGEVITSNAKAFKNIPVEIPYKGELIIRGEAYIRYSDFERINEEIPMIDAKYKNPRNLCSGSVRQLNSKITASRNVNYSVFSLSTADGVEFSNSKNEQMMWLEKQGFNNVYYKVVDKENLEESVQWFAEAIEKMDIPSDGLVLIFDDIKYGQDLGVTAKFPRNAIAFKWKDEIKETILKEIEWSPSRTGQINPVAIFEPVELEGTTVSRASVHNLSILKELHLGIGDEIKVYKANMIIPQISENITKSDNLIIPSNCPVCGEKTIIKNEVGTEVLFCNNNQCPVKKIKSFTLFVSRDAMNIESMSEATITKFIEKGIIKKISDIYKLEAVKENIISLKGFGLKSYEKMINNIEISKDTTASKFLYSLGIPGIGVANAKMIAKNCNDEISEIVNLKYNKLIEINGVGDVLAENYVDYFSNIDNLNEVKEILKYINISKEKTAVEQKFDGMVFVITGKLVKFTNRKELVEQIEQLGGKVSSSVSSNTNYLINNDIYSNSSKNKKAKDLDVPIITEEEIINKMK